MITEITDRVGVGTSITNPILRHTDGVRMKKMDEWHLHELMKMAMEGVKRQGPIEIRW